MSFLLYPSPHDTWHLLSSPVAGAIHGIPSMRGYAIATNYIHVAIEQGDGRIIFGHLAWFEKDKKEQVSELDEAIAERHQARATKKKKEFAEFDL